MHLRKAIYKLKQAALAWWRVLDKSMSSLGCTQLLSDSGLFVNEDNATHTGCGEFGLELDISQAVFAVPRADACHSQPLLWQLQGVLCSQLDPMSQCLP